MNDDEFWRQEGVSSFMDLAGSTSTSSKKNASRDLDSNGRRRSSTNPPPPVRMNRRPSIDGLGCESVEDTGDTVPTPNSGKVPSPLRDPQYMKSMGIKRRRSRQNLHQHRQTFERTLGKMGKGLLCCEYSDHGTGDFRTPSFMVVDNFNGSSISPLRYKRHAIYRGKLPMPDAMPAIRCLSEREASTLVVTMVDPVTGLEVDLVYGKHVLDARA